MQRVFGQFLKQIQKTQKKAIKQAEKSQKVNIQEFQYKDLPPKMIAIDGSNRWIWYNPDLDVRIAIIRVVYVIYEYQQGAQQPLVLIEQDCKDFSSVIAPNNPDIHNYDLMTKKLHMGIQRVIGKRPRARNILALLRTLREFELAEELAWKHKDSLIVIDGALTFVQVKEFEDAILSLRKACQNNKNTLIGISKRNTTRRLGSSLTDEAVVREMTRNNSNMLFAEIQAIPKVQQLFPTLGKTFLAKLHSKPVKTFRVDIDLPDGVDVKEIFSHLSYYSMVDSFRGYPFPLVDAHNIAVLLRRVPDMYNHDLIEAGLELGIEEDDLFQYLITSEKMEIDPFHRHMDDITKF